MSKINLPTRLNDMYVYDNPGRYFRNIRDQRVLFAGPAADRCEDWLRNRTILVRCYRLCLCRYTHV